MEFNERIESLFEQYKKQREGFGALQQKMQAITVTTTSPRREVSVTVGHGGVVSDVSFPTGAYRRLAPAELTALIMQTMNAAKEQAQEQAAAIIAPMLPQGMNAKDLLNGRASADMLMPPQPRMANSVREQLGLGKVAP
jgi:DNA-binding protein YbaB